MIKFCEVCDQIALLKRFLSYSLLRVRKSATLIDALANWLVEKYKLQGL